MISKTVSLRKTEFQPMVSKKLLFFFFLIITINANAQNYTLSGFVTSAGNGESLTGASVTAGNASAKTNNYGFYSISLPAGNYTVEIRTDGYKDYTEDIHIQGDIKRNYSLSEITQSSIAIEEVVITSTNINKVNQALTGVERINVNLANKLPVILGERDILKTVQLLPGVKAGGDGQSGFSVRGGNLDQNLILLDDAPVYNASHLLGFFSTFNSDAIKDVTMYKGSAPAQFGGRISSVVDVRMKEGNNKNFGVSGGLGLISSRLNVEGPIQKDKSSFLISGRRTYLDLFLQLSDKFKDNKLYFYDLNTKVNYKFSEKSQLFLSGYFGRDVLGLKNIFGINWGNATTTARYNHVLNEKLFSNTVLAYSNFDFVVEINKDDPLNAFDVISKIQDISLKQEFDYFHNDRNSWKFGVNAIHHNNNPGQIAGNNIIPFQNKRKGIETAIFAANDWKATENLKINYGLRLSAFYVLGGNSEFYTFDDQNELISAEKRSGLVKSYYNLEPRFAANYKLNDASSAKLSYTRNTQHLHLISNSVTTSPADRWVLNSNNIKPQIGDQISLGYVRNLKNSMYELSAETYYKYMQNQIDYKDNSDERDLILERQLLFGKGRAYGIEFLAKKNKGKLTGWLGYTLSKSERKINGVNDNNWYNLRYDRTHDFTAVGMYDLTPRLSVSAIWTYQTGNAVTFPVGVYSVADQTAYYYTGRNQYRMPAYHRLDLGATWQMRNRKTLKSELAFSLYNAYGRQNAYLINFKTEENSDRILAEQTALFRFVPSISYNFKF